MGFEGFIPDKAVRDTPEFRRVTALPRRIWTEDSAREMSRILTPLLATPGGQQQLFPVQAQALHDAGAYGGFFASIRVGGGKTLLSLLSVYVMGLQRPILLVPASIVEKTKREALEYAVHWRIPYQRIRIVSYESLGRDAHKHLLANYRPDGILCDEAHRLKNPKAAVTRRVTRYMNEYPDTRFGAMSGTITKRSLKDYAHLLKWVFKHTPPVPRGYAELEEWCAALDEKTNPMALDLYPGPMLEWAGPQDLSPDGETSTARRAWRRRLGETPGVVATADGFTGASLRLDTLVNERRGANEPTIEGFIAHARDNARTPDNWIIPDGVSLWAIARQLSLGFYYMWDPRPPEPWSILRQAWNKQVREWIKYPPKNNPLDSEFQVAKAVASGEIPDYDEVHRKWREIEPSFKPNKVAVWLDDGAIMMAAEWLARHPKGICWVEHRAFGERLSQATGLPYHHKKGLDSRGRPIEGATGPIIASVASNATGRNLQRWSDNLIVSPPPNALQVEQVLGRTHREKQEADEVTATFLLSCVEHVDAIDRAYRDARYTQDSTGQAQKIIYGDWTPYDADGIRRIASRRFRR